MIMKKILVLGYDNFDRQEDGVAWYVLVGLAKKLNLMLPVDPGYAFDSRDEDVDLFFNPQLLPEMVELIHPYKVVFFVDAHMGNIKDDVQMLEIHPKFINQPFTHRLPPEMLLSIHETMYENSPLAYIFSIHGCEFEFSCSLSEKTQKLAEKAVDMVYREICEFLDRKS